MAEKEKKEKKQGEKEQPRRAGVAKAAARLTGKRRAPKAEEKPRAEAGAASATARFVRISPRKMRLVADQVRGKQLADARTILAFSKRSAATVIGKTIASAAANAENNHDLSSDELYVSSIIVNEGPTFKRYRPRAMGRAYSIRKRTSHLKVELAERREG